VNLFNPEHNSWVDEQQAGIAPLDQKVRDTLLAAGFNQYKAWEMDTEGFMTLAITPVMGGMAHVQVQHVTHDEADTREIATQYAKALAEAGLTATVVIPWPEKYATFAQVEVPHKEVVGIIPKVELVPAE
jgi:hypothetical protein